MARWLDRVEQQSGGRITFERFWGGSLATVIEHLDLVNVGTIDVGVTQFGAHPAEIPLWGFERIFPFGPPDPSLVAAALWTLWDEYPEFDQLAAAQNQKLIFAQNWDTYNLISFEPMVTLDDYKGKVVALWGVFMPKYFEALGASGVATPAPDRYLHVKQKLVDASSMPSRADVVYKLYEVAKHVTIIGFTAVMPFTVSFNLDKWNKFPPDLQKMMLDIGREVSLDYGAFTKAQRVDALAELKKQGCTFHETSQEDMMEWAELTKFIAIEWADKMEGLGLPGYALARRYREVVTKLGYEFPIERPDLVK